MSGVDTVQVASTVVAQHPCDLLEWRPKNAQDDCDTCRIIRARHRISAIGPEYENEVVQNGALGFETSITAPESAYTLPLVDTRLLVVDGSRPKYGVVDVIPDAPNW